MHTGKRADNQQDSRPRNEKRIAVEAVVNYPRSARVGQTYRMTVDLRTVLDSSNWSYDREEFVIFCTVVAEPLFRVQPLGVPAVIVHRFGGTLGPAHFNLIAADQEETGTIQVSLSSGWGMPIAYYVLEDVRVVAEPLDGAEALAADELEGLGARLPDKRRPDGGLPEDGEQTGSSESAPEGESTQQSSRTLADKLRAALSSRIHSEEQLRLLLGQIGVSLEDITSTSLPLDKLLSAVVAWAEHEDGYEKLIAALLRQEPDAPDFISLEHERQSRLLRTTIYSRLQAAFLDAFPLDDWRRLLYYSMGTILEDVVTVGAPLRPIVSDLIRWADEQGRLRELFEIAVHENPGNKALAALHKECENIRIDIVDMSPDASAQAAAERQWGKLLGELGCELEGQFEPDSIQKVIEGVNGNVAEISRTDVTYEAFVLALVQWAERKGKLRELLGAAVRVRPGSASLAELDTKWSKLSVDKLYQVRSSFARAGTPATWSERLRDLYTAILCAFDEAALRRMLRFAMGVDLDAVARRGPLQEVVSDLVEWAELQGRLQQLFRSALNESPSNPLLVSLAELWDHLSIDRLYQDRPLSSEAAAKQERGKRLQQVHTAFTAAFTESALRQLLIFEMAMDLDTVARAGPLVDQLFDLLDWAERQARLHELIEAAVRVLPGDTNLAKLREVWNEEQGTAHSQEGSINGDSALPAVSNKQRRELYDALADSFDVPGLRKLLALNLGLDLDIVVDAKRPIQPVLTDLLRWAESQARLQKLLDAAVSEQPQNEQLLTLRDNWIEPQGDPNYTAGALTPQSIAEQERGRHLRELHTALASTFQTESSIYEMLRNELNVNLHAIVANGSPLPSIILDVMLWMERRDRLQDLLLAAVHFAPQSRELAALNAMWARESGAAAYQDQQRATPSDASPPVKSMRKFERLEAARDAVLSAFSLDELVHLLGMQMDVNLYDVVAVSGNPLRYIVSQVVQWAERTGRLQELLEAALRDRPNNAKLIALVGSMPDSLAPDFG